jgi:hypothetical protein
VVVIIFIQKSLHGLKVRRQMLRLGHQRLAGHLRHARTALPTPEFYCHLEGMAQLAADFRTNMRLGWTPK